MNEKETNVEVLEREESRAVDAETSKVDSSGESHTGFVHVIKRRRWLIMAIVFVAAAAIAVALLLARRASTQAGRPVPAPSFEIGATSGTAPKPGEMVITLSPEELATAQIKTEAATVQEIAGGATAGGLRTTGIVQSNQYKEVPVMPIAGGIVREVKVQLGDRVRRGQPLAALFSTELADAQSDYLKMLAEVEEHHQHHRRTTELVEIGAASREELEQATSAFKAAQAKLASARQKLILLGMSAKDIDALRSPNSTSSMISIAAPSSGTIVSRAVNAGEVIEMGKELFRIADLSTVWVIAQVYESNFAQVQIGTPAVITTQAYPGRSFNGRVSYIDPRVDPQTRTAQVRIEVANPGEMLKLGMFVDVGFGGSAPAITSAGPVVVVPRAAIQTIGAKQVIYVATDKPGTFIQREVTTGLEANGLVQVYSGVSAGERVVTEGSFLLRAESLKLNPQQSSAQSNTMTSESMPQPQQQTTGAQESETKTQSVKVTLSEKGFQPDTINLKRGVAARITFVRQVEVTCATEVLIPAFNIKRELPMNEPVTIEFTPDKAGEFGFTCPMNMVKGKIIVR
ncbi:MAG TPA: efflux RND transporter periplasmic adaptor subunit [Blastocatellia bacterium]|nr:efflux RND transporter periplasmic adaptor subunit [Blastocatellia bacterium]